MTSAKSSRLLTALLFCACAVGLFLHLVLPDRSWAQAENRPLTTFSSVSSASLADGSLQQEVQNYWSDQMPGRETFFHVYYLAKKYTGTTLLNNVFLCADRLIGQPLTPVQNVWQNNAAAAEAFCASTGLPGFFMAVPTASQIDGDQLPWNAIVQNEAPVLDGLPSFASDAMQVLDIRPALLEGKGADPLYYASDHHWTSRGAGLAAMALLEQLDPGQTYSLAAYDFMPVCHDFQGTLASKTGSVGIQDTIEIAPAINNPPYLVTWADGSTSSSIYVQEALEQKDQYQVFLGANQSLVRVETTNTNGRHLLLFKDSYANSMIQFLLPEYQSITIVDPRYFYDDLDLVLSLYPVSEVAFVFGYDNLVTDSSLKDLLATCSVMADWTPILDADLDAEQPDEDVPTNPADPAATPETTPAEETGSSDTTGE